MQINNNNKHNGKGKMNKNSSKTHPSSSWLGKNHGWAIMQP